LRAALASPVGADPEGDFLRTALAADGVAWSGRKVARTAVTAVLPSGGERAMVTYDPREATTAEELAAVDPRAVVICFPRVGLAPPGARVYATTGDAEARGGLQSAAPALAATTALLLNEREALLLSGRDGAEEAARALAEHAPCVVVTLGVHGALAVEDGECRRVGGIAMPVVDTTGAGDLFAAAYVWADLHGMALEERLRWAVLYAALSVGVPTGAAGAATIEQLARAAQERGLALPAGATMSHRGGST
jgi:sugar/nucleoside kinase (ribokinase family)